MPPTIALVIWLLLLLALLRFDPAKVQGTSAALWFPLIWLFFIGSRLPSQWFGGQLSSAAQAFEEGNSFDRAVFLFLIFLSIAILVTRSFRWTEFFSRNLAITMLLLFALVSVFWSDLPFVAFKRWIRDIGTYLSILVVLSDPFPLEAVRSLLRRLSYLLIPLSIVFIKYFPMLGMEFGQWTGGAMPRGVATSKNTLGAICLISGLFFFWDTMNRWSDRKERRTKRIMAVNFAFLAMTLWLLNISHSATSGVCLSIGCVVVVAARSKWAKINPRLFKVLIPASFCVYLIAAFGFDFNGELAGLVGRNPTLTDRTDIWKAVLSVHTNPIVGTGYESFWVGPRLSSLWRENATVGINEAHNGYLEVYLNLGLIGISLLAWLLVGSFRSLSRIYREHPGPVSLGLALWAVTLFYNMTEAAFIGYHFMWAMFLVAAIAIPELAKGAVPIIAPKREPLSAPRLVHPELRAKGRQPRELSSTRKTYPRLR